MIIIDTALQKRVDDNNLIKVGIVGSGAMARGVALQLIKYCQGFHLAVVSNRHLDGALRMYKEAGIENCQQTTSSEHLDQLISDGQYAVTDDPMLLCQCSQLDVIVEITGAVEFGCRVATEAISHGKHVVLMNAELDSTVGPILKTFADQKGVVITNVDGDQPGVIMNLFRYVKGMGVEPVLCGNIKGLQDPYRTPTTQKAFAERWKQSAPMVTSFADGTKISFEQALVANATGMKVAKRGMIGPVVDNAEHIDNAKDWFGIDLATMETGIVDYVVGATPGPGVFVIGKHEDPAQQHLFDLYKLGKGPLYSFYTPYHLCHFEVHNTIARAVLFQDAAITPTHGLCVDVVATAKRDLKAGETLDGIGHYMTYGECENAHTANVEALLPIGVAEGCVLKNDVPQDATLTYADVQLPKGRLVDQLRKQQALLFFGE